MSKCSSLSPPGSLPVSGFDSATGAPGSVGFGSGAGCDSGFDFFSRAFAVSAGFVVSGCWAKTPAHKAQVSTHAQPAPENPVLALRDFADLQRSDALGTRYDEREGGRAGLRALGQALGSRL